MVWLGAFVTAIVLLIASAGCGGGGESNARAAGSGGPGGNGKPKQPPVPVAVQDVTSGDISSYYTATATLAAEKEAEILARATGVVGRIVCEEGDLVRQGDVMLYIDNDEYIYRLREAEAAVSDLQSRLARLEEMRSQDLVSDEEAETMRNDLKAAEAAEGLARVALSYTKVTAPFTGRVVTRHVDVGQTVSTSMPLFVLADFDPLLARIHVPSKEFNMLKPDQPVDLVLESDGTRLQGRIKLISPTIDPASGTIKVTVEIPQYPEGTRPGDFAQVSIVTERRVDATLVPKSSVVTDRGEQVVFVSADSTAERRVVELGFQDDDNAQILSGVAVGETIVVKGQRSLKHGSPIKILEENVAETKPAPETNS